MCKPQKGEVVLVNSAAGAVGSLVGQLAKIKVGDQKETFNLCLTVSVPKFWVIEHITSVCNSYIKLAL